MRVPDTAARNQQGGDADKSYFSPPPAVSLLTRTASLIVPIFTTSRRLDFYPKLSLFYDYGAENEPFRFSRTLSVLIVSNWIENEQ